MLLTELIQVALQHKTILSHDPNEKEWQLLYTAAKKQALLGITYAAIERLPRTQRPSRQLLLRWCLAAERIKERNIELNRKVIDISRHFRNDGFANLILKGQGNAQYYKMDDLDLYRTPGDVDIWLDGSRKDIISYARKYNKEPGIVYHHIDFPDIDGVHIEIHFTPSWMNCYFTNARLQRFFNQNHTELFGNTQTTNEEIPTPSLHFNRVYILIHIYRHLFHEGIGLRQLMDYYYVLRQGQTDEERIATVKILQSLRMRRFTAAAMWVLQHVFRLEECYLLTTPNEKDGRFLLNEIMLAGNLGKYDKRIARNQTESNLSHGLRKVMRNLRFVGSYPSEALWSPIFKIWHYFWRKIQ